MHEYPVDVDGVDYYRASDGRMVAIHVTTEFEDYSSFPPYLESDEERAHLSEAYDIEDPMVERRTKAHITEDEFPLQLVLLNRPVGSYTKPHFHEVERQPEMPTRHQVMICMSGRAEIEVFTITGEYLGTVDLGPEEIVVLAEGHSVRSVEPNTRIIEIKQGPFPTTDEADKVDLDVS